MSSNKNYQWPRIRVGSDDFKTLRLHSDLLGDKSLLIQELLENSAEVLLITRPRRWGKSLNMDMLRKFFEIEVDEAGKLLPEEKRINRLLFTGGNIDLDIKGIKQLAALKIHTDVYAMEQQGKYPVIYINFKDVKGSNYQDIEADIKQQVVALFLQHVYLESYISHPTSFLKESQKEQLDHYFSGKLDKNDLKQSLRFLSELLYKHFNQKVYILIDEYDTPINNSYIRFGNKPEEFEQVLELFRTIFGSSLKSNPYLEKGVITGILRITKANLFSDLNNVREYTLLDTKFASFYGFTQSEVELLLSQLPAITDPAKIKDWYNGYTFGGKVTYNPWSIMCCLSNEGKLDYYWIDSGGTALIDKMLLSDEMQVYLQNLTAGEPIISPIATQISFSDITKPMGLFSLLLFSGYLNPTAKSPEKNIYALSIPNEEVKYIYETRILQWVTDQLEIDSVRYYSLIALLPTCRVEDIEAFKTQFQKLLCSTTSFYQTGENRAELFYSGFMLGLIAMLTPDYIVESERETGSGRADIILLPQAGRSDNAIIIEYKVAKTLKDLPSVAEIGLQQIIDKKYDTKVKEHRYVKKLLKLSMAFCGKQVAFAYQIDTVSACTNENK
ncbi:AAA family ATPase [Candidatus Cardinium hertigii]|uniref:AAA-ATPase-like domain-containing protein n=1 Tax=Candidatus Cardinium hertigii TaxID=247481 RepID=A0A3N2QCK1_9BACT|nr:AAA family ATPase [Candidatus Cardinium hertigii]ROT47510.1 hypothetical protein EDM02_01905 [Candidatus Cardinium hertigii]